MPNSTNQAYTSDQDHTISLADAGALTASFRTNFPGEILGGFYGKDAMKSLLSQEGCIGFRYYFAQESSGSLTIVIVGVDAVGNDIVDGELMEHHLPMPPFKPGGNVLNQ